MIIHTTLSLIIRVVHQRCTYLIINNFGNGITLAERELSMDYYEWLTETGTKDSDIAYEEWKEEELALAS